VRACLTREDKALKHFELEEGPGHHDARMAYPSRGEYIELMS
jgi:hypothetical protein